MDLTYERILKEIKKPNRRLAQRVFQCLVVAVRPLRVEELAEVLAVEFDDAEGIPMLKPDWRWEEQELALLSACSSLIAIVRAGRSRVVQFSHFSVKEFLTSPRLATASGEVSSYFIDLEPAHTILAQACLGVLLQIPDDVEGCTPEDHARYAAEHWTTHAQFGGVSSRLYNGMEYLFDVNKPHFKVWLTQFDIDTKPKYGTAVKATHTVDKTGRVRGVADIVSRPTTAFSFFAPYGRKSPLYYAALCGFHDLVEHLVTKHPQDVNADGGYYVRPLVAALAGKHFRTADLLRHKGANLNVRAEYERNPLHVAAFSGNFDVVRILIEYDPAYINARDSGGWTPLFGASRGRYFKDGSVLRLLLEHGADINVQDRGGRTPLHWASSDGALEVVRLLLGHGANVEVKNNYGHTALQEAAGYGHDEVMELLREHGAK